MRGHWISQTRKLNKHYQSAAQRVAAGLVLDGIALNAPHLCFTFVYHVMPETAERKLLLTLAQNVFIDDSFMGTVRTAGIDIVLRNADDWYAWDETVEETETEWMPFAVIPHIKFQAFFGGLEGSSKIFFDTEDETIFNVETNHIRVRKELLTYDNTAGNNTALYRYRNFDGTNIEVGQSLSGGKLYRSALVVYIKKSSMTYTESNRTYRVSANDAKRYFDQVYFNVEWKKISVSSLAIEITKDNFSYPFSSSVGIAKESYHGLYNATDITNPLYIVTTLSKQCTAIGYSIPSLPSVEGATYPNRYPYYFYGSVNPILKLLLPRVVAATNRWAYGLFEIGYAIETNINYNTSLTFYDTRESQYPSADQELVQVIFGSGGYISVESEYGWRTTGVDVGSGMNIGAGNFWNNSKLRSLDMHYPYNDTTTLTARFIGGSGGFVQSEGIG